ARRSARLMHIGWVLVWVHSPAIRRFLPGLGRFLPSTGFRFDYRADGVSVYRCVSGIAVAAGPGGPGEPASVAASSSSPSAPRPGARARQPAGRAGALPGRQPGRDPRLTCLPGLPHLGGDHPSLGGEVEAHEALVLLVPAAPEPALALQAGGQPAHGALLQAQQ